MKKLSKKAACLLTACLLASPVALTATAPVRAQEVPAPGNMAEVPAEIARYMPVDINGHWAQSVITELVHADIVNGEVINKETHVNPENPITRAEFVKLLVAGLNLNSDQPGKNFTDVPQSQWFHHYVQVASALGIVQGMTATTFAPNQPITRSEIAAIISRAFANTVKFTGAPKTFTDVPPGDWARPAIDKVSSVGIVNGYGGNIFKPGANATRAEAMKILHSALHLESSALPEDKLLTDLVINNERENFEALQAKDYTRPLELNKQYNTGYLLHAMDVSVQAMQQMKQNGVTLDMTHTGTYGATVVSKSDRFATVDLTGASYDFTVKSAQATYTQSQDTSGLMLLRKLPDGTWKNYSSQPKPVRQTP
ncbi:MAG: S-layer homology domain-containing protein [Tumebacillaceae bacterium]